MILRWKTKQGEKSRKRMTVISANGCNVALWEGCSLQRGPGGDEDIAAQGGDEWKAGPREKGAHRAPQSLQIQRGRSSASQSCLNIYMDTKGFNVFVSFLNSNKQIKYMPVHSSELIKTLTLAGASAVPWINGFVSHWRGSSVLRKNVSNEGEFISALGLFHTQCWSLTLLRGVEGKAVTSG